MLNEYFKRDHSYQLMRDFYDKNCQEGNIEEIKIFFKQQEISEKKLKYSDLMEGIYCAIKKVNTKLLDYLLLNIPIGEEELFRIMTYIGRYGDSNLFKILYLHHKEDVDIRMDDSEILVAAVENNNLKFVEYLLTNQEIKNPDIHLNYDKALRYACIHEHIEIIKFLLTSDLLIEKANVHAKNDECLIWSFKSQKYKTVDYLLFDYKIKKTEYLDLYLKNNRDLIDYIKGKMDGKI